MGFPSTINGFKLYDSKEGYAFYVHTQGFGFANAMKIELGFHSKEPNKTIVQVKHLAGNSWGRYTHKDGTSEPRTVDKPYTMTWLVMRTDYYPTMVRAMDAMLGKTEIPKGKRKARPIQPMTEDELKLWTKEFGEI